MNAAKTITAKEFPNETKDGIAVVTLHTSWCASYELIRQSLDNLARRFGERIKLLLVDINLPENTSTQEAVEMNEKTELGEFRPHIAVLKAGECIGTYDCNTFVRFSWHDLPKLFEETPPAEDSAKA